MGRQVGELTMVRHATPADRFAMVRMGLDFLRASAVPLPADPVHMEQTALAYIAGPDRLALILEAGGGKRGMLLGYAAASELAPVLVADVALAWVDPGYRGHGGALFVAFDRWAADRGARLVCVHSLDDRTARFHARRGYAAGDTTYYREA